MSDYNTINDWFNDRKGILQDNHDIPIERKEQLLDELFVLYGQKISSLSTQIKWDEYNCEECGRKMSIERDVLRVFVYKEGKNSKHKNVCQKCYKTLGRK